MSKRHVMRKQVWTRKCKDMICRHEQEDQVPKEGVSVSIKYLQRLCGGCGKPHLNHGMWKDIDEDG